MTHNETLWSLLEGAAANRADECFVLDSNGCELSFLGARDRANVVATALEQRCVGPGSVVSWQLTNEIGTLVLMLALSQLRAVQNPLLHTLREREVLFICTQMNTNMLVTSTVDSVAPSTAALRQPLPNIVLNSIGSLTDASDLAGVPAAGRSPATPVQRWSDETSFCFYTSGTTAEPKGVRHSDSSVIAAARGLIDSLALTASDRVPLVFPIAHIGGAIHCARAILTGGPILLSSNPKPDNLIPFLQRSAATVVPGSPPFVAAYLAYAERELESHGPNSQAPHSLFPHARLMNHGGSPKPPQLHAQVRARLGTAGVISGYGLTECPMAVFNRPGDHDELLATTEGRPTGGAQVRIDSQGLADPPNEFAEIEGEILIRGPQLMLGYVDSSLDASTFTADGFLRTGDLGTVDSQGYLRVTGRLKDVIIRNMENVSAREIEDLLSQYPPIREVCVLGLPDHRTGERVCAVVVPADPSAPPTLRDLTDYLRTAGLSTYKLPEQLELVHELPTGLLNKVDKRSLIQRLSSGLSNGTPGRFGLADPPR